jgi:hypothetical protein
VFSVLPTSPGMNNEAFSHYSATAVGLYARRRHAGTV